MTNTKQLQGNLFLFTAAFIWGFGFVAQRSGMDHIGPFMFSGLRFLLGAAALIPVIAFWGRRRARRLDPDSGNAQAPDPIRQSPAQAPDLIRQSSAQAPDPIRQSSTQAPEDCATAFAIREAATRKGGLVCGLILFIAASLQQVGLVYTTAGKTAFITALYIVLVPIFGIFLKHKIGLHVWASAGIAAVGLYLLCIKAGFVIAPGDLIVLVSSVFWTLHILAVDHFASRADAIKLSAYQFAFAGLFSLLISLFFEASTLAGIAEAAFAIIFVGIFSCSIAFTFQVLGQKHAAPTTASLILSMEAVFGAIGGYLLLGELLSAKELVGCALMFAAVILSQLPVKGKA